MNDLRISRGHNSENMRWRVEKKESKASRCIPLRIVSQLVPAQGSIGTYSSNPFPLSLYQTVFVLRSQQDCKSISGSETLRGEEYFVEEEFTKSVV